jgi:hypothetical protein
VDRCLQLHGGYGYMLEYPIARAYLDARITTIYGGTTEIMKEIAGRFLDPALGLVALAAHGSLLGSGTLTPYPRLPTGTRPGRDVGHAGRRPDVRPVARRRGP